jgi:hypothetical protein
MIYAFKVGLTSPVSLRAMAPGANHKNPPRLQGRFSQTLVFIFTSRDW